MKRNQIRGVKFINAKKGTISSARMKETVFYTAMLALPVVQFCLMYIYVHIDSFALAFERYDYGRYLWNGFENFKNVFKELQMKNGQLRNSIFTSIYTWALCQLLTPLYWLLPYYCYKKFPGHGLFKVTLYLPSILSEMVVGLIYKMVMNQVIPEIALDKWGVVVPPLVNSLATRYVTVWAYSAFMGLGSSVLIYVSLMARIPESLVEYAQLEGCTPLKEFIFVTFPLIFPTWFVTFIMGLPGILGAGIPLFVFFGTESTEVSTVGYYLYCLVLDGGAAAYPKASAISMLCTLVTIPLVIASQFLLKKVDSGAQF